jgi:hypothetical protein
MDRHLWEHIRLTLGWYTATPESLERRIKRLLRSFENTEEYKRIQANPPPNPNHHYSKYAIEQYRVLQLWTELDSVRTAASWFSLLICSSLLCPLASLIR